MFHRLILVLIFCCLLACSSCFRKTRKQDFTVARKATWEGVNLHGTEKKIQGFTNDLVFEIARIEDVNVNIKSVEYQGSIIPLLDDPNIDAVLSVLQPTPLSLKSYVFSEPFFTFGPVLITKSSSPITSFDELQGKVVGFERGIYGGYLRDDLNAVYKPYDQITLAVEDLLNGNTDALLLDSIYAYQLYSGIYAGKIIISPLPFPVIHFRAVVKKGTNEEFITLFNKGLKEVKENGTYEKMLRYWEVFVPS